MAQVGRDGPVADALPGGIGVVGAGTMGAGIAQVAVLAGHRVAIYDKLPGAAARAVAGLGSRLDSLAAKGKLTEDAAEGAKARLDVADDLTAFKDAVLVIEAVVEDLGVKRALFADVEAIVGQDCLLATNTSSLSVTAIGAALSRPGLLAGMHFFNPAPLLPLVEVVSGLATAPETADAIAAYADAWGKTTVRCSSTPGFIVNRVARPFYGEALRAYEEGVADFAAIDAVMRGSAGFRMGPFELMDMIGLDVNLAVSTSVWEATGFDPRYIPSWTQKEYVAAGRLGRKSGRGFYEYVGEKHVSEQSGFASLDKSFEDGVALAVSRDPAAVPVRTVARLVNEACDAVNLGIASPADVDTAMRLGVNYPCGPLEWGDELGPERVLDVLDALDAHYRDGRYRPSPELRRRVAEGKALTHV
jgi:3-hydroxybutyryl-CoA dehydrogenase